MVTHSQTQPNSPPVSSPLPLARDPAMRKSAFAGNKTRSGFATPSHEGAWLSRPWRRHDPDQVQRVHLSPIYPCSLARIARNGWYTECAFRPATARCASHEIVALWRQAGRPSERVKFCLKSVKFARKIGANRSLQIAIKSHQNAESRRYDTVKNHTNLCTV